MDKLGFIKSKILSGEELEHRLAQWRFKGYKIVFTNGCFDILHRGHIEYLAKASSCGDILIVGINTDASVHSIKGPGRPAQNEKSRVLLLASLGFVSAVVLFDEDTPLKLIEQVQPDVLVKGADYKEEDIVGYDIVKRKGGEIVTIKLTKGYSTSSIIDKLTSSH
jgi:rfaE bifunctional protein nucleotidyltransferase chain/domain